MVFARGGEIGARELRLPRAGPGEPRPSDGTLKAQVARVVAETERRLIGEALERAGGNRTKAAEELGLSRRGLQLKLRRYGIT
jgi:DNA-binding NtrC family response regulator